MASNRDLDKLRARLTALEYMFADMYAKTFIAAGGTLDLMQSGFQKNRERLKQLSFPTIEPVESDHYAAELEAAVSALQELIESLVARE